MEINHYKSEAMTVKTEFAAYRSNAEAMQAALKSSNEAITLKYKQSLIGQWQARDVAEKATTERIKADEELRSVKLSAHAVSVFNSTTTPVNQGASTPPAIPADVGGTDATLADLLAQSAENNSNHWKCIDTVHEWQHFWTDYTTAVKAAGG
jgi:hypothetical protein